MGKQTERIINAERVEDLIAVFGSFDENIKRIEEALSVKVINRGTDLRVCGDEEMVDKASRTLEGLLALASKGEVIDEQRVRYLITLVSEGMTTRLPRWQRMWYALPPRVSRLKPKPWASSTI